MNRFEMQSYEPLAPSHELTGYASYLNSFETDGIKFPVKKLHSFEEYYRSLPAGSARGLIYGLTLPLGMNGKLFGLEKELGDKDIIHTAETSTGYSYQAARYKKEHKKKLAITVWENIPFASTHQFRGFDGVPLIHEPLRRALTGNGRIVRFVKDNADVLIAVTGKARLALLEEGVPEEKIRVLHMGIDTERFKPAGKNTPLREKLGISDEDIVALFIGRLVREKGVYDLLKAIKLIPPSAGSIKAVLAGSGPEREGIMKMIHALGIEDRVVLAGGFSYQQVPGLYHAADVFVLPSVPMPFWEEQFGMVLVEAMASGLPLVSTKSGSIPEVVEDAGVLVPPCDPGSLSAVLQLLMSDRGYRKKLGVVARERAASAFNLHRTSSGIASIYKEIM